MGDNFAFRRYILMTDATTIKQKRSFGEWFKEFATRNIFLWLAFLIPFLLMVIAYGVMDVSPFGDKQILVTDNWHQYFPFLADLQHKLQNGESLFWTWSVGGGVNYFSLMSYYLASPVNFLSVFIPADWLREFLMFSVCLKIGLAGSFTALFLRSVYKRNDLSLVMFGTSFSFCAFLIGYYWNTIWLDTVCIFPLCALGIVKLLTENKFRLFTITLALCMLTNYYIGFFVCIFVLLIFIAYSIVHWHGFKNFAVNLIKTGAFSLLAIGITLFFLLPAFLALQNTHASGSNFPSTFAINMGGSNDLFGVLKALKSITGNIANFTSPAIKAADAIPNISCGAVTVFFGFLYLTCSKVKTKEKIVAMCLILFMFLSCIIRQLDYIWHGFHFTNMIPYRFTFLISFVMIAMAFKAYKYLSSTNVISAIIATLLSVFVLVMEIDDPGIEKMFTTERLNWVTPTLIAFGSIIAFTALVVILYSKRIIPKNVVTIALTIVVIAQSAATGICGVIVTTVTGTYDYPRGGEKTAYLLDYMNNQEANTPELWRSEMTSTQTLNDGALNHYNGLSMFNSMANEKITIFYENMGMMGWKSGNRYTYAEASPFVNMFMNLKYLVARDGKIHNTYDMAEVCTKDNEKLFQNTHYIPMGFVTDKNLLNWKADENEGNYNPIEKQNEFFRNATGIEDELNTRLEVVSQGHSDSSKFTVNKTDYGVYSFNCSDSSLKPHVKWNYTAPKDGLYVMYADIKDGDDVTVLQNDKEQPGKYGMARPYVSPIGYFKKGDKISVYAELKAGSSGKARVYVDLFNEDVFEQGFTKLTQNVMNTTKLTASSMEGTIDVKQDGLFYTSIPYEKGWTAVVDGQKVDVSAVGNAMLAFPISQGEHTIKLYYYPNGFWPGFAVTMACILIFAALCFLIYVKKKKPIPEPAKLDIPEPDEE